MHLLGFSVNMLTLFGMILAIGLVVDDAIVVVEGVESNMAKGHLTPLEAAKVTMTQIAGALISIVLVLVAVFLPVAFLGGVTGKLYQQFAVTIAISMVISGIMALTLSPALAAIILKAQHGEKNRFFRAFERGFEKLRDGYLGVVALTIRGWPLALLAFGGVLVAIFLHVPRAAVELRARGGPGLFLRRHRRARHRQPRGDDEDHRACPADRIG
jgi:multidrug efflux pump